MDLEHHDIMVKTLNSYKQHFRKNSIAHDRVVADDIVLHVDGTNIISPRAPTNRDRNAVGLSRASVASSASSLPSSLLCKDVYSTVKVNGGGHQSDNSNYECVDQTQTQDYNCLVAQLWANNFDINGNSNCKQQQYQYNGNQSCLNNHTSGTSTRKNSRIGNNRTGTGSSSTDHIFDHLDNADTSFKLAHCRLIYNDDADTNDEADVKKRSRSRPKSAACLSRNRTQKNETPESPGGVLVDAIGHVYGQSKPRPWSALPQKFSSFLKTATVWELNKDNERRYSNNNVAPL